MAFPPLKISSSVRNIQEKNSVYTLAGRWPFLFQWKTIKGDTNRKIPKGLPKMAFTANGNEKWQWVILN